MRLNPPTILFAKSLKKKLTVSCLWQQLSSLYNTSVNHYHRFLKESSRLCQTIENSVPKAYMPRWLLGQLRSFMTPKEAENLPIIKDAIMWLRLRHGIDVKIIRADREFCRKETLEWLKRSGISFEPSIPYTHEQNGRAERLGRLIMTKGRAMRLSARFPHALWKEVISAAIYLYNRTPKESLDWKTPYEALFDWS